LRTLYDFVFFDCDSTLTAVEGIDELARMKGGYAAVAELTRRAMEGQIELSEVYLQRLERIVPTRREIAKLRQIYRQNSVEDARGVIQALHYLGAQVHVVSGGLYEPVADFSLWLGVPRHRVHAVHERFDSLAGRWWAYWEHLDGHNLDERVADVADSPLTTTSGKARAIERIVPSGAWSLLVGDGSSDLAARNAVRTFVGYGGVVYRSAIEERSDIYIKCRSLSPVVVVAGGKPGMAVLKASEFRPIVEKGLKLIATGAVAFKDFHRQRVLLDYASRIGLL
jgi:phosphoserine phosphatase